MGKKKKAETALLNYVDEQFGNIRGVMINGVPYFVGKDVATALGYANFRDALSKHVDEEDKKIINFNTVANRDPIKGNPNMTLINESGLYSLILQSKLPAAKEFKRWVTSEVLPSIRETGAYAADKAYQKWLSARKESKEVRRDETDAIKLFVEYAQKQGYQGDTNKLYSSPSIESNLAAGLPMKGGRDNASLKQLNVVAIGDNACRQIFLKGMAAGMHYTQILQEVREWRHNFNKAGFIESYIQKQLK